MPQEKLMTDSTSSVPGPHSASPRRKRSGVVVPHRPNSFQRLIGWFVWLLVRFVALTTRFEFTPGSGKPGDVPSPVIFCLWHNRLALCVPIYDKYLRRRKHGAPGIAALVSASKDGAFLTGIFNTLGVEVVRGSSSRRGAQALLELSTKGEAGWDLAITPDGPRGPCYCVHEGIISLAQVTGLPIQVAGIEITSKLSLKSWDRFQIPLPFGKCRLTLGELIRVPAEASPEDRAGFRSRLEEGMKRLTVD
jgi:lysophospholipid acyltransferase (LPLAT)-like uncharacterized protein